MKIKFIATLFLLAGLSWSPVLRAQTTSADTPKDLYIPPMLELIDSALKHSAMAQYRTLDIEARKINLKSESIYWTRNLGLQADTRYGTFDNFSTNNNGQSTTLFNSTSKQFNYGVGLYIKLPLGDVLNRKNQINHAKVELEQAKQLALAQDEDIRQTVIRKYQELLLRQRLANIRSTALGNARVNMEMVEKEFRNGVIPVTEYVRISDIVTRAEAEYEEAKTEFIAAKLSLEEMVGFSFSQSKNKK